MKKNFSKITPSFFKKTVAILTGVNFPTLITFVYMSVFVIHNKMRLQHQKRGLFIDIFEKINDEINQNTVEN